MTASGTLLSVTPVPACQGGGVVLACSCTTFTRLPEDGLDGITEPRVVQVSCSGCQSVTLVAVGPRREAGRD